MNTNERIQVEKKEGLGIITLDSPESRNILDSKMLHEIEGSLVNVARDEEIRAVIITGNRMFSAGADIRELKEKNVEGAEVFSRLGHRVCNLIEDMEKPVIAAIAGYAIGGGCEIALACDMRIAAEDAKLGQPEVNLGLIPGFGATQRLTRLIGIGRAKELIMTGRTIDAKEAEAIGLVNKVVKGEDLMEAAEGLALAMAGKSPLVLRMAKGLINATIDREKGIESEIVSFSQCFATGDHAEGINAFLEKRKPLFRGI